MATRSKTKTQARQASADKRPKAIAKYVRISPRKVKIVIDPGPTLKRYVARSRGSASPMLKRTSHISVVLDQKKA